MNQSLMKEFKNLSKFKNDNPDVVGVKSVIWDELSKDFDNLDDLRGYGVNLEYKNSKVLKFIKFNQLESLWMSTNLMCIGEKTSAKLNEIKWKKIFLFNPGEEEFLLYKI